MPTAPFGLILESALKENVQGGTFTMYSGVVVNPRFFCCISGTTVGVAKDPVALVVLTATVLCTGVAITADYSRSWSPSSTINNWSVAWGDGQVSAGAWPGVGSVAHPLGGYVLPGTYTVTLTVTDLLGATGVDTVQVTVLDCTIFPGMVMYAGCGASGVWYTDTGGLNWADAGGGGLGQPLVYDVKPNWFTIGLPETELWAATDAGLYTGKGIGTNIAWVEIVLPQPDGFPGVVLQVAAVCPSKFDPLEVYVIAYDATDSWLYRTVDNGETWTEIHIEGCDAALAGTSDLEDNIYGMGAGGFGPHLAVALGRLYSVDDLENSFRIGIRDDGANTWGPIAGMGIRSNQAICAGDNAPYILWVCGYQAALAPGITLQGYTGFGWVSFDGNRIGKSSVRMFNHYIYTSDRGDVAGPDDPSIRVFDGAGVLVANYDTPGGATSGPEDLYVYTSLGLQYLIVAMTRPGGDEIHRHLGAGVWSKEADVDVGPNSRFVEIAEGLFFANQERFLYIRNDASLTWEEDRFITPLNENIYSAFVLGDTIYIGTDEGKIFKRDPRSGYVLIGNVSCDEAINNLALGYDLYYHDNQWLLSTRYDVFGVDDPNIYRIPGPLGTLVPHADGRTHIIDMSADGVYVFFALINDDGEPVILRADYDLAEYSRIYEPAGGTWGGVVCDFNWIERVWIFGDLTNTIKIRLSDDWGASWTSADEGAWGAGELVRPVLPSIYDPTDVSAILNVALQAWHSGDDGVTWANQGNVFFASHCGARDWIEDTFLLIGRSGVALSHLRWSPYLGQNWYERSIGLPATAPITSIQIVG